MKNLLAALMLTCPLVLQAQDYSINRLNNSPRHHELIKIKNSDKHIQCFTAYPEKKENTTTVIVIHENRGLTDWVRSFADELAEAGFLAIAPDLLSDFDTAHNSTTAFANSDDARNAIYQLNQENVSSDLNAVEQYIQKIASSNKKVVVIGFCWGGSQSFRMATYNSNIKAALVFYGSAPETMEEIAKIQCPVYGFYGENDQRINAAIPETEKMMKEAGKVYNYEIYSGAGHAFMRLGEDPEGTAENKAAREKAWLRVIEILKGI